MLTNILQIADLWKEKGNPEKAIMALRWGLKEIEGSGCEKELASLWQMLLLTLSMFEQEYDELEEAKKHIRQAVRVEQGNLPVPSDEDNDTSFLVEDGSVKIIQTACDSDSQIIMLLSAMENEELLVAAKEEYNKHSHSPLA